MDTDGNGLLEVEEFDHALKSKSENNLPSFQPRVDTLPSLLECCAFHATTIIDIYALSTFMVLKITRCWCDGNWRNLHFRSQKIRSNSLRWVYDPVFKDTAGKQWRCSRSSGWVERPACCTLFKTNFFSSSNRADGSLERVQSQRKKKFSPAMCTLFAPCTLLNFVPNV